MESCAKSDLNAQLLMQFPKYGFEVVPHVEMMERATLCSLIISVT